jgi:hypothetical protein
MVVVLMLNTETIMETFVLHDHAVFQRRFAVVDADRRKTLLASRRGLVKSAIKNPRCCGGD